MTTAAFPLDRQSPWRDEFRATLSLAWPLILTNLSMSLIGATDVVMVGWLGPTELAAASLGFNLCMTAAIFCAPSATLPTQPVDQLNAEGARLARSSVLTSRINATLPSPRMVAPEMPATRR